MYSESGVSFLKLLAEDLFASDVDREPVIVLPGKRARLFLYRAWAGVAGKPVWAPKILTMEEFVFGTLNMEQGDDIDISLALWEICKTSGDETITFEKFSGWASIILRDFNEVDLFLADPHQVFVNLLEAKELQMWVPGEEKELSEFELNYIGFYGHLLQWYTGLKEMLKKKGRAYQGMAFRMLAEDSSLLLEKCQSKKIIFAGFNAFTPSEEKIINNLNRAGIAQLRWDTDSWYLDVEGQEAGYFLRKWRKQHPDATFRWIGNTLSTGRKKISVYGVHGSRAQAHLAGELLRDVEQASTSVAVVLPDDTLLMPVLNAIPPEIQRFNVTMGMPFRQTPALSWLQLNLRLFTPVGNKQQVWVRVTDLIPVLRHPWFMMMVQDDAHKTLNLSAPVSFLKLRFYRTNDLAELYRTAFPIARELLDQYFCPVTSPEDFINKMELTLRVLLDNGSLAANPFDQGAVYESLRILNTVREAIKPTETTEEGFVMLRYFMSRLLQAASIPFTGEPLEGIQILGLLETRNLDFKHVILLSANEGVIPAGRKSPTLIPTDIRKHHNLPGVQHQDAIFAYHFYHLIQRAETIDILYNTDLSSNFSGEISRFIRQIEAELIPANPSIEYKHMRLSNEIRRGGSGLSLTIDKSEIVFDALKDKLENHGLSPSQICRYIKCPLMFYFSFVAALGEPSDIEETLDAGEMGTLVHDVLREIYKTDHSDGGRKVNNTEATGIEITVDFITDSIAETKSIVLDEMQKHLGGSSEITGKNLIISEVAEFMIRRHLENEKDLVDNHTIRIIDVEQKLKGSLIVLAGEERVEVKLKGVADRIDIYDGVLRITDYKTGKVEPKDLNFSSIADLFSNPKYEKALQLMFYCLLFSGTSTGKALRSGIFVLKSPSLFYLEMKALSEATAEDTAALLSDFENGLMSFCSELLDRSIPFSQTDDPEICRLCSYYPICLTEC